MASALAVAPKPDAGLSKKKADVLCQEIEAVVKQKKRLTPKLLLDRARSKSCPIHAWFEWDDSIAAEKWRITEARKLIASVEITVLDFDGPVRRFHSVPVSISSGAARRQFVERDVVIADDAMLASVSADLYATMLAAVKHAESLGLPTVDRAWGSITRVVRQEVPRAVK